MKAEDRVWVMAEVIVTEGLTRPGEIAVKGLNTKCGAFMVDRRLVYATRRDLFGAVIERKEIAE